MKLPSGPTVVTATLRTAALVTAVAIVSLTLILWSRFFTTLRNQRIEQLVSFADERRGRDQMLFSEAEETLTSMRQDMAALMAARSSTPEAALAAMTSLTTPGRNGVALRSPASTPDLSSRPQLFLPLGANTPGVNLRATWAAYQLLATYGPAWRLRLPVSYYIGNSGETALFWDGKVAIDAIEQGPNLVTAAPYLVAQVRPVGVQSPAWTNVYLDRASNQHMVSVSLAIEEDGVFVGSISHDILLSDVMERTLRHSPSGTASSLFTREGYVIAHPGYEIKPANELELPLIKQPDSEVRDLWLLARAAEATGKPQVLFDEKWGRYVVVAELTEPQWMLVTTMSRAELLTRAFQPSGWVLLLGLLSIVAELLVLKAVLRRKVADPLSTLAEATRRWQERSPDVALATLTPRDDEIGQLARDFCTLHGLVSEKVHSLEEEVGRRKAATTALEEIQANLRNEVATATAELQFANLQLSQLAMFDSLTGLANRQNYEESLRRAIELRQVQGGSLALMFIDLDGFKSVNDQYGHETGDVLLHQVAHRLVRAIRAYEVVARLGGDEFVVLLNHMQDRDGLSRVATRILAACREPFHIGAITVTISASVGVALFPDDVSDPGAPEAAARLQQNADLAMYEAKRRGKDTWSFFNLHLTEMALASHRLTDELRVAIEQEQFVVHLQTIHSLPDGGVTAAESLVRWQHPTRGLLYPEQFVPSAEKTHLVRGIDRCVQRLVIGALRDRWQHLPPGFYVAINCSAHTLSERGAVDALAALLAANGVPTSCVAVEVTESALLEEGPATDAVQRLRELGLRLILDDFGVGYSCLSYLKRIPLSTIKLDRAFVRDVHEDLHSQAIARTVFTLARALSVDVIAEGVEDPQQIAFLSEEGCTKVQGFFYARPAPFAEVLDALPRATTDG